MRCNRLVMSFLVAGVLSLGPASLMARVAAADREMVVKKVEYGGWKNNLLLSNGDVELIVTLDVGPRIISYRLAGGKNVFKEFADQMGKSGEKEWMSRGGHRLWVGPEDLTRTYFADNGEVKYANLENDKEGTGVRFTPAPETEYGIQKQIDVHLAPKGSHVRIVHRISNIGDKATNLAPWALTVLAPGGIEIIPLPPKKPHPGPPKNARSPKDYAPNQLMSVWPFTDFKDGRWDFGSRYVTLRQDPTKGPTKIGFAHRLGWVGYLNQGTLFVKRVGYEEGKRYPDQGVNLETFTNEDMLECESLGPIVRLGPGKAVEHTEKWQLFKVEGEVKSEADIDQNVLPKLESK